MPDRDWRVLVEDMIQYADRAYLHCVGLDLDTFVRTTVVHDAVIRCLEVIGEAARYVPDDIRTRSPEIPWTQIVATRHILVHHYAGVDLEQVWRVASERLLPLIEALKRLLAENP